MAKHPLFPQRHFFEIISLMSIVIMSSFVLINMNDSQSLSSQAKSRRAKPTQNLECVTAGCSGQLCVSADKIGTVTTCEWKEEYRCYQEYGTCERQVNGTCGWTSTDELTSCLQDAWGRNPNFVSPAPSAFPSPTPSASQPDLPSPSEMPFPSEIAFPAETPAPRCPGWMVKWFGGCLF